MQDPKASEDQTGPPFDRTVIVGKTEIAFGEITGFQKKRQALGRIIGTVLFGESRSRYRSQDGAFVPNRLHQWNVDAAERDQAWNVRARRSGPFHHSYSR